MIAGFKVFLIATFPLWGKGNITQSDISVKQSEKSELTRLA